MEAPPPLYSPPPTSIQLLRCQPPTYASLPSAIPSSSQRELSEHTYDLTDRKGRSWAQLKVLGDAILSKHIPTFFEGQPVRGSLALNLESPETIVAIGISVQGRIFHSGNPSDDFTFLDLSIPLWSKDMGDPKNPVPTSGSPFNGKLQGDYSWPFSINLPATVALSTGNLQGDVAQIYHLPQTFMERHTRATIGYEVNVHIKRSKLRMDGRIQVVFGYVPTSTPGPPSALRQLAYQENSTLMGPDVDPIGWHTLRPVHIHGSINNNRSVRARCVLSLATPLCYTRGSIIPCILGIECNDLQALDLLSSPSAITLRLRRRVKFHPGETHYPDGIEDSELAAWWPLNASRHNELNKRQLEGEMHLKKDMMASTMMAHFSIEYSVVLFPFDTTAFVSADSGPLLVEPVEIATTYAAGPRPQAYSPPEYETSTSLPRELVPNIMFLN